jgi:hypothetical protein
MAAKLDFSVGHGGVNAYSDVVKIQEFLNSISPEDGGPVHKLTVTGIYDDATDEALQGWHQEFVDEGGASRDKETGQVAGKRIYEPVHLLGNTDLEEILEIEFSFQKIDAVFNTGGKAFKDDWYR